MDDTPDEQTDGPEGTPSLSDRLLDLFVFLPTGVAVALAEELPELVERGRDRLGVHVNSARAVGHFAVTAGSKELKKRSAGVGRPSGGPARKGGGAAAPTRTGGPRLRTIPYPEDRPAATPPAAPATPSAAATAPAAAPSTAAAAPSTATPATEPAATRPPVDAHVPDVATLAIPGFDTLSASQVVQRLDGLSRAELVAVRAYETSSRGRRTILSRVDQLLDERS